MAHKFPLGKFARTAVSSLKDPLGTAGKVAEQAKGTAAVAKMVAEKVGKTVASKAAETAALVVGRAGSAMDRRRTPEAAPHVDSPAGLRPVPDVNAPATKKAAAKKVPAKKAPAKKAAATPADVAHVVEAAVAKDPKRTAATPAKKAADTAAPAKKSSPGDKLPPRKKIEPETSPQ